MTVVHVNIRGTFMSEKREELNTALELMPDAKVTVAMHEPMIECGKCGGSKEDVEQVECNRDDENGEHEFTTPPLAWAEHVSVRPNEVGDQIFVEFKKSGSDGRVTLTLHEGEDGRVIADLETPDVSYRDRF